MHIFTKSPPVKKWRMVVIYALKQLIELEDKKQQPS